MKEIFIKAKTPIIIIVALLAVFFVYNTFFKKSEPKELLSVKVESDNHELDGDFLPLLMSIRNISLDSKILNDEVYLSLVDFSQRIVPEDTGRQNPFAPISGVGNASSSVEGLGFTASTQEAATSSNPRSR